MAYVWLDWLADVLRAEGCAVREYDGWRNRGRPASTGPFDPYGVLTHHTGTKTSSSNPAPTLSTCVHGRSDLPGPLCHVMIDYNGVCHVIAAGRANHGGTHNGNGPFPGGDANAMMVGFELDYSGSQDVSDPQGDATVRATAAVLRRFKRDASYNRGHKETSTTGKWDPGRDGPNSPAYDMGSVRNYVAQRLAGGAGGTGDDMPEYVSLSGPGLTAREGEWTPVKFDAESSDAGGVHSEDYAWLALSGATSHVQGRFKDADPSPDTATLVVRWAEYDKDSGKFVSAPAEREFPLTTGGTSVYFDVIDRCSQGNRCRFEVLGRGGTVTIGAVGLGGLYWR